MLLGVDVGGTFTDAVLIDEAGAVFTAKRPSTPDDQSVAVLAAARAVLDAAGADPSAVRAFAHGMTVATNALLEGDVARTALIATAGFTDVIELGRQARPELYRLEVGPREPLVPRAAAVRRGRAGRPRTRSSRRCRPTRPSAWRPRSPTPNRKPWLWRSCTPTRIRTTSAR